MLFNAPCFCLRMNFGMLRTAERRGRFLTQCDIQHSMARKRILVDENVDGFGKKLQELGYDVERVKILKRDDSKMAADFNAMTYAKKNEMMIITDDQEMVKGCGLSNIGCIAITDQEVFEEIILPKAPEARPENRILVDENVDNYGTMLQEKKYNVERVRELKTKTESIIEYAKKNSITIITKNKKMIKKCSSNGIRYIAITKQEVFEKIILPKINEVQGEPNGKV